MSESRQTLKAELVELAVSMVAVRAGNTNLEDGTEKAVKPETT